MSAVSIALAPIFEPNVLMKLSSSITISPKMMPNLFRIFPQILARSPQPRGVIVPQ